MPARKCLKCGNCYPYKKPSPVKCPECGAALQYSSMASPDTDWPLEVKDNLGPMSEEEEVEINRGWLELKAEAERRGSRWSLADLIGEGVRRPS